MECGSLVEHLLNVDKALGMMQELLVVPGSNKPDSSMVKSNSSLIVQFNMEEIMKCSKKKSTQCGHWESSGTKGSCELSELVFRVLTWGLSRGKRCALNTPDQRVFTPVTVPAQVCPARWSESCWNCGNLLQTWSSPCLETSAFSFSQRETPGEIPISWGPLS